MPNSVFPITGDIIMKYGWNPSAKKQPKMLYRWIGKGDYDSFVLLEHEGKTYLFSKLRYHNTKWLGFRPTHVDHETLLAMDSDDVARYYIAYFDYEYAEYIKNIFTLAEAADTWKLDGSTLRHAIRNNRFLDGEFRRSSKVWLVTRSGMIRLYGEPPK